jgi:hypothetical protein
MLPGLKAGIERYLLRQGFAEAPLRGAVLGQAPLLAVSLLAGLVLWPRSSWFLCFFTGAALFSVNFWFMGRALLRAVSGKYSARLAWGHFFRFFLRIMLLGLALAAALLAGASPLALALGMLSSLAIIALAGMACR